MAVATSEQYTSLKFIFKMSLDHLVDSSLALAAQKCRPVAIYLRYRSYMRRGCV